MRQQSVKLSEATDRMPGIPTETLCLCVLTAVWRDLPPVNATGVSGEAIHAHALESLVARVRDGRANV